MPACMCIACVCQPLADLPDEPCFPEQPTERRLGNGDRSQQTLCGRDREKVKGRKQKAPEDTAVSSQSSTGHIARLAAHESHENHAVRPIIQGLETLWLTTRSS